jgi:hypothetical protein
VQFSALEVGSNLDAAPQGQRLPVQGRIRGKLIDGSMQMVQSGAVANRISLGCDTRRGRKVLVFIEGPVIESILGYLGPRVAPMETSGSRLAPFDRIL